MTPMRPWVIVLALSGGAVCHAQEGAAEAPKPAPFVVTAGTKVPLSLINTISTKHSAPGDRVYLETAFPILVRRCGTLASVTDCPLSTAELASAT